MITYGLLLALAGAAPAVSLAAPTNDVVQTYFDCIVTEAKRLEPSGEAAATIAELTLSKCERLEGEVISWGLERGRTGSSVPGYAQEYDRYASIFARQDLAALREQGRHATLSVVVEARAKRAAKNNAPNQ